MDVKSVMGISTFPFDGLPNLNLADPIADMSLDLNGHICLDIKQDTMHPQFLGIALNPPLFPLQSIPFSNPYQNSSAFRSPQHPTDYYEPSSYGYEYGHLNPVVDFGKDMGCCGAVVDAARGSNSAEKQRRGQMSEKFNELRSLIPNQTKKDRASIIGDAAEYIKELMRTVDELKTLVHRKKCSEQKRKKRKMGVEDDTCISMAREIGDHKLGPLRSSWLQRKSKGTAVDVRIVEDEANIRLTQRNKANCLLVVATALDELQLELFHLASGNVGDYHTFMINTKIPVNSTAHASSIAEKFIGALACHDFYVTPYGYN